MILVFCSKSSAVIPPSSGQGESQELPWECFGIDVLSVTAVKMWSEMFCSFSGGASRWGCSAWLCTAPPSTLPPVLRSLASSRWVLEEFLTLVSEIFIVSVSRQLGFDFSPLSLKNVFQSGPLNPPQLWCSVRWGSAYPVEKQLSFSEEQFSARAATIARDHSLIINIYMKINYPNFSFPVGIWK